MPDVFSKEKRSEVMSKIRSSNTKPEILVRKFLFKHGFRFRVHPKHLTGRPDIVLKKHKTVIFINGCFWHGHEGCKYFRMPKNNREFWKSKFANNQTKDKKNHAWLIEQGWRVIPICECELRPSKRQKTLENLLSFFS